MLSVGLTARMPKEMVVCAHAEILNRMCVRTHTHTPQTHTDTHIDTYTESNTERAAGNS